MAKAERGTHSAPERCTTRTLLSPERACRFPLLPELRLSFQAWPGNVSIDTFEGKLPWRTVRTYLEWAPIIASDKFAHGHSPTLFNIAYMYIYNLGSLLRAWVVWVSFLNFFFPFHFLLYIYFISSRVLFLRYFLYVLQTRTSQRK